MLLFFKIFFLSFYYSYYFIFIFLFYFFFIIILIFKYWGYLYINVCIMMYEVCFSRILFLFLSCSFRSISYFSFANLLPILDKREQILVKFAIIRYQIGLQMCWPNNRVRQDLFI